jgi:hypothetical protein
MRKLVNIRFLIALAAILFSALPSFANWDSRFWPTSESSPRKYEGATVVFQADVVTSNIAYAVGERHDAAFLEGSGESIASDIIGWLPRKPENALIEAKQNILQFLPYYIDQTRSMSNNNPATAVITSLVYWNITNILIHCNLPTNFFEYTPVRNLAGHEGTGAGHWTNSAAYGWEATRKVLTNLIYTYQLEGLLPKEERKEFSFGFESPPTTIIPQIYRNCIYEFSNTVYELSNLSFDLRMPAATFNEAHFNSLATETINREALFLATYRDNNVSGQPAIAISRTSETLLTNDNHEAWSFELIDAGIGFYGDPQSTCTNIALPPRFIRENPAYTNCFPSTNTCDWGFVGTFTGQKQSLGDGSLFILSSEIVDQIRDCSVMNFLSFVFSDVVDGVESVFCDGVEVDTIFIGSIDFGWDLEQVGFKKRSNIIKWDFTYK